MSLDINLMEPALFLSSHPKRPAVLRGSCILNVRETAKIKKVALHLNGRSDVYWLNGGLLKSVETTLACFHRMPVSSQNALLMPTHVDVHEKEIVANHTLTLFDADSLNPAVSSPATTPPLLGKLARQLGQKKKTLPPTAHVLEAGRHVYKFELVLDQESPESIHLKRAKVFYLLQAVVHCPKSGLRKHGRKSKKITKTRHIPVIRCPVDSFLQSIEPVCMVRSWRNQLFHHEIIVSAKAAPLGHQLPVSISLAAPRSSAYCSYLAVSVIENVRYMSKNDPLRSVNSNKRILLFKDDSVLSGSTSWHNPPDGTADDDGEDDDNNGSYHIEAWPEKLDVRPAGLELNLQLQLPPCRTHAMNDSLQMHCDAEYKNVRVSHSLEVSIHLLPFA